MNTNLDKNTKNNDKIELLEKEGLQDYARLNPNILIKSTNLIYALIEFAKERYKTDDLTKIDLKNIFLPNVSLKRLYGTSPNELKERFPYGDLKEVDYNYVISNKNLNSIIDFSIDDTIKMGEILKQILNNEEDIEEKYKNALTETYEILTYLEDDSFFRLPLDIITSIEKSQNKNYNFFIDERLDFSEQKTSKETKAILYNLYRDYMANSKEKQNILNNQLKQMLNLEDIEEAIYNPEEIFKK